MTSSPTNQAQISDQLAYYLMEEALKEARIAGDKGEVPIGAVVALGERIIGRGRNEIEAKADSTAHAEILAIRHASTQINNWRLDNAILCVTLEPCTMCVGAMKQSRAGTLIIGAGDSRFGAAGSVYDLTQEPKTGPVLTVHRGVRAVECSTLLKNFFKERR